MYLTDLSHSLDPRGVIAPERGPARKLADFLTAVVAHASDLDRDTDQPGPLCFKCRKPDPHSVRIGITADEQVKWHCPACGAEGEISNWQGSFRDLRSGDFPH